MNIHDHFDGEQHCVQCQGPCRLRGDDLEISRLVRFTLEYFRYSGRSWLPMSLEQVFEKILGNKYGEFRQRGQIMGEKKIS